MAVVTWLAIVILTMLGLAAAGLSDGWAALWALVSGLVHVIFFAMGAMMTTAARSQQAAGRGK